MRVRRVTSGGGNKAPATQQNICCSAPSQGEGIQSFDTGATTLCGRELTVHTFTDLMVKVVEGGGGWGYVGAVSVWTGRCVWTVGVCGLWVCVDRRCVRTIDVCGSWVCVDHRCVWTKGVFGPGVCVDHRCVCGLGVCVD